MARDAIAENAVSNAMTRVEGIIKSQSTRKVFDVRHDLITLDKAISNLRSMYCYPHPAVAQGNDSFCKDLLDLQDKVIDTLDDLKEVESDFFLNDYDRPNQIIRLISGLIKSEEFDHVKLQLKAIGTQPGRKK